MHTSSRQNVIIKKAALLGLHADYIQLYCILQFCCINIFVAIIQNIGQQNYNYCYIFLPVIGRSVGLHLPASAGGQLFDCAEIEEVFEASEYLTVSIPYDENFDR